MVESFAATSLLVNRPIHGGSCVKRIMVGSVTSASLLLHGRFNVRSHAKRVSMERKQSSFPSMASHRGTRFKASAIRAHAMELTKEADAYREERIPSNLNYRFDTVTDRKPGSWPPRNKADNPALHNPLLRQERMGAGWLGAIFEWEGVLIEGNPDLEKQAWMALSQEEGKSPPLAFILRRIEGMKNEQAISEVLCWSRDPAHVKKMASRKEEIYQALQGGLYRLRTGSLEFVNVLMNYNIPMAVVSTCPRETLESAIGVVGIERVFSVIVAAEDVHRGKPDPEMFVYAAQLLKFIPERCIVFGNSNQTVEAAHDARMKCVAVASNHPTYELRAADLVVRHLNELSVVDLKHLADIELAEFGSGEDLEVEVEEEGEMAPLTVQCVALRLFLTILGLL